LWGLAGVSRKHPISSLTSLGFPLKLTKRRADTWRGKVKAEKLLWGPRYFQLFRLKQYGKRSRARRTMERKNGELRYFPKLCSGN
jgi:hypothetical protein